MKYQLLFIGTLLLFFACRKEETLPNPNPGPDPNCLEQSTIFAPDNKAAKIVSNLAFSGQVYDFQMLTPEVGYLFGASPVNNLAVLLKTTNGGKGYMHGAFWALLLVFFHLTCLFF